MTSPVNLGTAFDKENDDEIILKGKPTPRPRDAATLILVKKDALATRVLMGKRSAGHDFMPKKYVFPGGRVDPPDGRVPASSELNSEQENRLRYKSRRQPRAFALTAIRETFEETGLIIGRNAIAVRQVPAGWQALADLNILPSLEHLAFIGRAITPPYRPKRFDARFFMADADKVLIDDRPPMDGAELHDLRWVTLDEAYALDLPNVTRFMLDEVEQHLSTNVAPRPPFLRWTQKGHSKDRID
ncbi:MAG: NUDIX hydrolase [Henriciella sp.]